MMLLPKSFHSFTTQLKTPSFLWLVPLWVAMFAWRPGRLGFVYDDWALVVESVHHGGAFSWTRWQWVFANFADRPGTACLHFIGDSLCGANPVLWHIWAAVCVLFYVGCFYRLIKRLLSYSDLAGSDWVAVLAAGFWLVAPWFIGISSWPTMVTLLPGLALFAVSVERLIAYLTVETRWNTLTQMLCAMLGCLLTYECFYGQYLFIIALWPLLPTMGALKGYHRRVAQSLFGIILIQSGVLYWNRLNSPRHVLLANWGRIFAFNLRHWFPELLKSAMGMKAPFAVIAILLSIVGAIGLYRHPKRALFAGILCAAAGVWAINLGVLSLAGRNVISVGPTARTMLGGSFWLLVMFSFLLAGAFSIKSLRKSVVIPLVIALYEIMGFTAIRRTLEWEDLWVTEQHILASAPTATLKTLPPKAVILYDGPNYIHHNRHLNLFDSFWGLSGAMNNALPVLRITHSNYPDNPEWRVFMPIKYADTLWDGQRVCQEKLCIESPELWIWHVKTAQVERILARHIVIPANPNYYAQ